MDQSIAMTTMNWLRSAPSAFKNLVFASSAAGPRTSESPSSFTKFRMLPIELRTRIWRFALEPRILCIHLHHYSPDWIVEEDRYEGYTPGEPRTSALLDRYYSHGTYDRYQPIHMVITPCIMSHPCRCQSYPLKSCGTAPLPAVLITCHEGWDVCIDMYRRCLDGEYDIWGVPVRHPVSGLQISPASAPPITGVVMNFSIDSICFKINVTKGTWSLEIHHLAAIAAKHAPDIRKVLVKIDLAMLSWNSVSPNRWSYWKKWCNNGLWVPVESLVQMVHLKEVVVLRPLDKMLPAEWAARTLTKWEERLIRSRELWPVEWNGKMPSLSFEEALADV